MQPLEERQGCLLILVAAQLTSADLGEPRRLWREWRRHRRGERASRHRQGEWPSRRHEGDGDVMALESEWPHAQNEWAAGFR